MTSENLRNMYIRKPSKLTQSRMLTLEPQAQQELPFVPCISARI